MKTPDARRLDQKTLTEIRTRAVASVQSGHSPERVVRMLGIGSRTIYGWLATHRRGGWARKRGGRPPTLDAKALRWIDGTVTLKHPVQLQGPCALWTAKRVKAVIQRHRGVRLSKGSVCRLLRQLSLTPQHSEAGYQWLTEEYPHIKQLASA